MKFIKFHKCHKPECDRTRVNKFLSVACVANSPKSPSGIKRVQAVSHTRVSTGLTVKQKFLNQAE